MIIDFITSGKFYIPIVYIAVGIIAYYFIANLLIKTSKINIRKRDINRKKTIVMLVKNIIKYIIAIMVILAILGVYGVDTSKILASIGIVSVIIGLAFQDIIKDFLSGVSIIFDNQYTIGDWIEINGFKGEVIALGLTTTKIKAYTGEVKIISNSSFSEVTNFSLNKSKLLLYIDVAYATDIKKLEKILASLEERILNIKDVIGSYELLGVDKLDDSSIVYMVTIDCKPMTYASVKRESLRIIKEELDKNGIEIPYNKLDVKLIK